MDGYFYDDMDDDDMSGGNIRVIKNICTTSKPMGVLRFHSTSQHNYYIRRDRVCPYCNKGSEEIIDPLYENWMKNRVDI